LDCLLVAKIFFLFPCIFFIPAPRQKNFPYSIGAKKFPYSIEAKNLDENKKFKQRKNPHKKQKFTHFLLANADMMELKPVSTHF
jgi:hypothetical protein